MNPGGVQADLSAKQRPHLATVCGLLALVMLLAFVAIAAYGHSRHGLQGVWTAAVAVGICWLCATVALIVSSLFYNTPNAVSGQLGSILLRTVLPLFVGMFLQTQVPYLAAAGVFGMMVPAYLISLVAETLLSLWLAGPSRSVAKAA